MSANEARLQTEGLHARLLESVAAHPATPKLLARAKAEAFTGPKWSVVPTEPVDDLGGRRDPQGAATTSAGSPGLSRLA